MNYYENVDDLFLDGEIFKDIDRYVDYQVSNFGRIKSFNNYHRKDIIILKQSKDGCGYLFVDLCKNGKEKKKKIHRLMFESFNNYKLKKGEVIHHIDKNPLNNDLDNFKLMTNSEHLSLHHKGLKHSEETKQLIREKKLGKYIGENHPGVKLTEQNVIAMKSFWNNNIKISNKLLAKWYKVSQYTISKIKNNKNWKHIK